MIRYVLSTLAVVFLMLASSPVLASSQLGYGSIKCSIFNAIQHEKGVMVQGIDSWTLGFLSGLNQAAATTGGADALRTQQPDRVAGYIRAYCSSNKDDTILSAAISLWKAAQVQ